MTPTDPDRIVIAGDWHANTTRALEAIRTTAADGVRLLPHTGDLGVLPTTAGHHFLDHIDAALAETGTELWFIDGNHDDHHALRTLPRQSDGTALLRDHLRYLPRGHRWTWHDRTWLALGGAHSVNNTRYTPGINWWPEETITQSDVDTATAHGHADAMITHDAASRRRHTRLRRQPPPLDPTRPQRRHRQPRRAPHGARRGPTHPPLPRPLPRPLQHHPAHRDLLHPNQRDRRRQITTHRQPRAR
jgi:predicted phosphodiesterase